jgi:hypothetical protein
MKVFLAMKRHALLLLATLASTPGFAEIPAASAPAVPPPTAAAAAGETSLTLDLGFGIRAVPPSRVTVPVGESLRVTAPDLGEGIQYIWTKDGRALPGATGRQLALAHVTSGDAGTYACLFSTPATLPQSSQLLVLGVGPTDRLLNLSTRATVGGSEPAVISGFVVAGPAAGKKLILRAIGPSLGLFGVPNPLRAPVLRIYDAQGQLYTNGYAYPAVVGGPTYESDLAESLARTGAFPLPPRSGDAVEMRPFVPGSYTVQVTSGDGSAGTVLLEIYEVP